jgi:hypothetical protein
MGAYIAYIHMGGGAAVRELNRGDSSCLWWGQQGHPHMGSSKGFMGGGGGYGAIEDSRYIHRYSRTADRSILHKPNC